MERIFIGKVMKDTTAVSGYYLRNLLTDKVYDSNAMFHEFEGKEVIVKISDLPGKEKPSVIPRLCAHPI